MPYYKNAFDFENSLIEVANSVLQSEGITRSQERIGVAQAVGNWITYSFPLLPIRQEECTSSNLNIPRHLR